MSPRHKSVLVQIGSFVLGGGLLYLALRHVDFGAVLEGLRTADYRWLPALLGVLLVAHALRAFRWIFLLETLPTAPGEERPPVSFRTAFYSVLIGYMVNYAAPRVGEVARAANMAVYGRLRFSGVFGTIVVERIVDVVMLALGLASLLWVLRDRMEIVDRVFLTPAGARLDELPVTWTAVLIAGVVVVAGLASLFLYLRRRARTRKPAAAGPSRLREAVDAFGSGLASVYRSRRRVGIVLTTLGIWFCYLLGSWIPLAMFHIAGPYQLGLLDAWALLMLGALGIVVPSPGGVGSYHYITIQSLLHLYGVGLAAAATYAVFSHAAQLVLYTVAGFACLVAQGSGLGGLRAARQAAQAEEETRTP